MKTVLINMLKIFGVVFFRFRFVPRLWCVWLVGVNLACLLFIQHIEAQILLAVTLAAVIGQALLYGRIGFTRLLGIVHITWIPMFGWMATRLDTIAMHSELQTWLTVLFFTNLLSLIIDANDLVRFAKGERAPHYYWG